MLPVEELIDLVVNAVEERRIMFRFVRGQTVDDSQLAVGHEIDDGVASARDRDLLAREDTSDQCGELALRFMHVELGHTPSLAKSG